jgi:hypothetical protein
MDFEFIYRDTDREQPRELKFKIEVQPTGEMEIDLSVLDTYMRKGSSVDTPSRAIQALDIALKNGAVNRFRLIVLKFPLVEFLTAFFFFQESYYWQLPFVQRN